MKVLLFPLAAVPSADAFIFLVGAGDTIRRKQKNPAIAAGFGVCIGFSFLNSVTTFKDGAGCKFQTNMV